MFVSNKKLIVIVLAFVFLTCGCATTGDYYKSESYKECERLQESAKRFIENRVIVEPQIIDKSGFYAGEKVMKVVRKRVGVLNCPHATADKIEFVVWIYFEPPFSGIIEGGDNRVKYDPVNTVFLKPTMTITGRTFDNVYPKYANEDNFLRVDFDGEKVRFINKSDSFLQILSVSVYYNEEIFSFGLDKGNKKFLPLSPQSTTKEAIPLLPYLGYNVKRMSEYRNLSKSSAMQKTIRFGFAVKYEVNGQEKTFYKLNDYNLYEVIKSLYKL